MPADALARVLDDVVEQFYAQAAEFIRARPAGISRPGYRPGDLLRLFLYGYSHGVCSSRGYERACWINLELAWAVRRLRPDFERSADCRKNNGIECLFGKLKHFCRVFSRYEKLARRYLAFVHLAAALILLR